MEFGETLKQIRQSKGLSQAQLSQGLMSRSNLSRFESGHYYPSYDKVIGLISRLELSLEEVLYIANDYQLNSVEQLHRQLVERENQHDIPGLKAVSAEAQETYADTAELAYQRIYLFAQLALNRLGSGRLPPEAIKEQLLPYFKDKEEWYLTDLRYLNNALGVFDLADACFIANQALKNFEKYQHFNFQTNVQTSLLINVGTRCFEAGLYAESRRYFQQAKDFSESFNHVYNRLICLVYLEILAGNEEGEIANYFFALELLKYHETVEYLKKQKECFSNRDTKRSIGIYNPSKSI